MNKQKLTVAVASRSLSNNDDLIDRLKLKYEKVVINETGKTLEGDKLRDFLLSADKAIIGIENITDELLTQLPKLKVISKYGVGLNNIDLNALKKHKVMLGFKEGVNKQSVAELALLLFLISLRKIHLSLDKIKSGTWSQEKGKELYGKTVGIVGYGNIGKSLMKMLKPFDCQVLVYDNIQINDSNVRQVSFNELLSHSNIISIHLPLNNSTENMFNSNTLAKLKKDAILINTSRGGIVNEEDLYSFLKNNKNAFAALDVFRNEPAFKSNLLTLDNFYATSHLGSMTYEGVHAMGKNAIENLEKALKIK